MCPSGRDDIMSGSENLDDGRSNSAGGADDENAHVLLLLKGFD